MNVPRDQIKPGKGNDGDQFRDISVTVRSNSAMSEADIFRNVVNQVVGRNKLVVDRDLLNRYINQRIESGEMLTKNGTDVSGTFEPEVWGDKKKPTKGFLVGVSSEFQQEIAAFAKAPIEKLKQMESAKDPTEKPSEQGSPSGNSNVGGNTSPGNGAPSTQSTPGTKDNNPSATPNNQPEPNYDVPHGKTLSEIAGGRGSQPIDVTLSRLATAVYDRYGPPPEGWRAVNEKDIAERLGVAPDDPKVSEWFRQYLGGKYAVEGDLTKQHEFKAEVYTDGKGNFVLAYRGTSSEIEGDWDNNFRQARGYTTDPDSDKFSGTAVSTAQEFVRMFGQYDASGKPTNLAMVGHSQGGGLATMGSLTTGVPAVTFDASGIHANTLARINMSPEQAKKFAENGGIRAYSLRDDVLTNIQENSIVSILAPDAIGTKIRLNPAKGKEGRMMEEYGEAETGWSKETRKAVDNSKIPIGLGTLPILGPIGAGKAANIPDALISHSPKALTDALVDHKPWERGVPPIPTPRPTPTPTPDSTPVVDSGSTKVAPVPQPRPTPTPKKDPDRNDQLQSVVRPRESFEGTASIATDNTGRPTSKNANEQALLDDPTHPRNPMLKQALGPINARDAELGRGSDDTSLRLAAGMTADARARGLETIAFAQFSPDGRRFYMADTSDPSLPWARTAVGNIDQALQKSVADSTQRVDQLDQAQVVAQQHAERTQQKTLDQGGAVIRGPQLA